MINRLWLDNPLVTSMLFFPRRAQAHTSLLDDVFDGTLAIRDTHISYRYYENTAAQATLLCFHGNAEAAADYDAVAAHYRRIGLAVLVVDYRGYGWSEGRPLASKLLADAEAIFHNLPQVIPIKRPLFVIGRSLGSASAVHLAHQFPEAIHGLIIESGFAHAPLILSALGLPRFLLRRLPGLFGNQQKMQHIRLPLLVIHGEADTVIPVEHGQLLYDASPAIYKRLLRVPQAGHNDLVARITPQYIATIQAFIEASIEAAITSQ